MKATKWILRRRFEGLPKFEDFSLETETLPELQDGEILAQAEWYTVDPYMRAWSEEFEVGETMPGGQVARVIESKDPEYPVGTRMYGNFGWRDLTIYKPREQGLGFNTHYKLPDFKGLPASYALGALGMPGNTAYFGFTTICEPKEGETLVVSGAGGAVGSLVGQIGKMMGLKVIGFTGTDEKVEWLKEELGFDHAFNYKTCNLDEALETSADSGVDCYFDNVGGTITAHVLKYMNTGGRIAVCGAISTYNSDGDKEKDPYDEHDTLIKEKKLTVKSFGESKWRKVWFDGIHKLRDWIIQGKIKAKETINHGFHMMPQAFIDLFEGKNIGKQVVKADTEA